MIKQSYLLNQVSKGTLFPNHTYQGAFQCKISFYQYRNLVIKKRRSHDRLIFIMGIPILVRLCFLLNRPPGFVQRYHKHRMPRCFSLPSVLVPAQNCVCKLKTTSDFRTPRLVYASISLPSHCVAPPRTSAKCKIDYRSALISCSNAIFVDDEMKYDGW